MVTFMQKLHDIRISAAFVVALLVAVVWPLSAQNEASFDLNDTAAVVADTLIADVDTVSVDPAPEWYVAPVEPVICAAVPARAKAAAACPTDSVVTYDIDGNFAEVACYDYDEAGRVVCTTGWTYNAGKRIGTSKEEKAYDAKVTEVMTATYTWDNSANNWKGAEKKEYVYNSANKMESNTISDWVNGAWLPKTRYTYAYDASNREIEYYTFARGANNELVYSKTRIREYNAKGKMTLEIQYTAYTNGAWSAGTKKMYDFDASGNQIEYTYYSALTNGNWGGSGSTHEVWAYTSGKKTYYEKQTWSNGWVNSSKETWEYNGPSAKQTYYEKNVWSNGAWIGSAKELWEFNAKGSQTLHEKYGWANGDWAISQQDNSVFDASNRNILVENYTYTNGVQKGTKKEEYTYYGTTTKKTSTIKYKWATSEWVYNTKAANDYDAAGNTIETANYTWKNDAWAGTGARTLSTYNSSKKVIDQITQKWPTNATNWVNLSRTTTEYSGANKTQEAKFKWQNEAWVGTSRSDYHYNAAGKNDTVKTYTNDGVNWIYSARTINTYNAAGAVVMVHNSSWNGSAWVLTSMTRSENIVDAAGNQLLSASWKCGSDSVWIGVAKDTAVYNANGDMTYRAVYESWANGDWVPSYTIETTYDDAGNVTFTQRMDWVNNAWKGHYRYENAYDAAGRIISSAVYNNWNTTANCWIGTIKTETVYDGAGRILTVLNYSWKDNTWSVSDFTQFTYDAAGNTIEQIVQSYVNGEWVNVQRFEKAYKGSLLITSNDYTWANNDWQFTRRSEKTYDNDTQAKLRREISGSWTNGILNSFTDNHYYYNCDPHAYLILFKNEDGTLLSSCEVNYGEMPEYTGATPTKPATAQYTYTFAGWDKDIVAVTGEATYTATYTQTVNKYTITFQNEDGSVIEAKEYEYGAMPVAPANPTKEATAQYTYTFSGWDNTIAAVTGVATYKATFSSIVNKYTITWVDGDGNILLTEHVAYGDTPAYTGNTPTKTATDEYTYEFNNSWSPAIVPVTGDATYTALFTETGITPSTYIVTFMDDEGNVLFYEIYSYGQTPDPSYKVGKESDAQYDYTFAGWSPALGPVTGDVTYTATFTATIRSYIISFVNDDGTTLYEQVLEYGQMPEYVGDVPTKQDDELYTYTFSGWSPEIEMVAGAATYTATYTAELKQGTAIDNTINEQPVIKVMENGVMYIIRAGQKFTTEGVVVQ